MDEIPSAVFDVKIMHLDTQKIVLISDMHANLPALQAVLDDLSRREFDHILCLGDLVGYYTNPSECIELVKKNSEITVMGNHDWAAVDLNNPLFRIARPHAQESLRFTNRLLSEEEKNWLLHLPLKVVLETPYASATLVHGHPVTIFDYVYGSTRSLFIQSIENALSYTKTDYLFVGHSHIQGTHTSKSGQSFVNPGAIGQPRDGDNRAAYAIIDLKKKKTQLIRVSYDIGKVIADLEQFNLPKELGDRLKWGV